MNAETLSVFGAELIKLGSMIKEAPFKSKAQQRFMFAAEARGDVAKGTARRWAHETKGIKKLPERVKKAGVPIPAEALRILKALSRKEGENLLHVAEHAIGERQEKKAAPAFGTAEWAKSVAAGMSQEAKDSLFGTGKPAPRKEMGLGKILAISAGAGIATGLAARALRAYLAPRRGKPKASAEKKAALTSQMLRDQLDPARPEIKAMLRKPGRGKGVAIAAGAGVATGAAIAALRSYLLARRKGEK